MTAECLHCGYDFVLEKEQPTHIHYYNEPPVYRTATGKQGTKILIYFIFIVFVLVFLAVNIAKDMGKGIGGDTPDFLSPVVSRKTPESEPMVKFSEYVFGKKVSAITTEEFSEIKYLKLEYGETLLNTRYYRKEFWTISYSFEDYKSYKTEDDFLATVKTAFVPTQERISARDIECFRGLTKLDFAGSSEIDMGYGSDSLQFFALENLTSYCGSFNQSADGLNDVNLQELTIQLRNNGEVESLLAYENLELLNISYVAEEVDNLTELKNLKKLKALKIETFNEKNIDWVSSITNLKSLHISQVSDDLDISALYTMSQLEELHIGRGSNLKSIDFVKNMPKLSSLTLISPAVKSLEVLKDNKTITRLHIKVEDNVDISAIDTLVNLKYLHLDAHKHSLTLENFAYLEKAEVLYNDYGKIVGNLTLNELYILDDYSHNEDVLDFSKMVSLSELEKLSIFVDDFTLSNTEALAQLTKLKTVSIVGDYQEKVELDFLVDTTIENISLSGIVLPDEFTFGANNNIKSLTLSDCYFRKVGTAYDYLPIGSSPFAEALLSSAKNVEELIIPGCELSDLSFASELDKLVYLNIFENYVSDLSPIAKSQSLKYLQCSRNQIYSTDLLSDGVRVLN